MPSTQRTRYRARALRAERALRFFFAITLGRADLAHQLARTHYPRKLPRVLAPDEVARLLEAAPGPGLEYKAALSIAYGAGLRGCEVVMLPGRRHRFQAHADPRRDGQGPQGSAYHAVAAASGAAASVVVAMPVAGLAVPGPRSASAIAETKGDKTVSRLMMVMAMIAGSAQTEIV